MEKKLTGFAIFTIVIQTIITVGFNWIFFLIYYRLDKYAFLSTNHENDEIGHGRLFFTKDVRFLSIVSFVFYFFFLIIFSYAILLSSHSNFFIEINFYFVSFIAKHIGAAILIALLLLIFFTFSYQVLIKNVYNTIYKNNHQYFNNYKDFDLVIFIILSIATIGWFYLCYLMMLGFYELYLYWINKKVNKADYNFSSFGIMSLFIIFFTFVVLSYFLITYFTYLNIITIYLLVFLMINPILNYGFYELKMRLFLDNQLNILNKKEDKLFKKYINKKIITLCVVIISIAIIYTCNKISNNIDTNTVAYDNLKLDGLVCNDYPHYSVCHNSNSNKEDYSIWKTPIVIDNAYLKHKELIQDIINPDHINTTPIIYTNKPNELIYSSDGKFYSYNDSYMYVQTYYKFVQQKFVPVFNIVKNLDLMTNTNGNTINFSIYDNDVYLYDFTTQKFEEYNRNYKGLDTTRLMVDHLAIQINSNDTNLYGYQINNEISELPVSSDGFKNLANVFTLIDPFLSNELLLLLDQSYLPLSQDQIYHRTDFELLFFELIHNKHKINYFNDQYFLYADTLTTNSHKYSKTYYNECPTDKCLDNEFQLSNKLNVILDHPSQMLYTDQTSKYLYRDNRMISFYINGKKDFSGEVNISFDVKTIKQYFDNDNLRHEMLLYNQ